MSNCGTCFYFRGSNELGGRCYLNPPTLGDFGSGAEWARPWVSPHDVCRNYQSTRRAPDLRRTKAVSG